MWFGTRLQISEPGKDFPDMYALLHSMKTPGAQSDLEALLTRMRQRQYPETIPVLASYWLKTVYESGHQRGWWKELNEHLKRVLRQQPLDTPSRDALIELQNWIQQQGPLAGKISETSPPRPEPFRANLSPEWLAPYIGRLLNEWLPAEVASLLVDERESAVAPDVGIPVLAVGRALERLLVRERLSPGTLEMFLQPELSPQYVYPADAEMLQDVVLALLGRTWAPPSPVMPATVLGVAAESPLVGNFREAVRDASFIQCHGSEEIHVPVAGQALEILKGAPLRIASIMVTMDGRWWEPKNLQVGEQRSAVYKPGGRLRIDYSAEHAKLVVPWPETQLCWSGDVHFRGPFEIFGREWHAASWETDWERTSLNLVFSRVLPTAEIHPADAGFRRSHPASVDIAWAALESALATSVAQRSRDPIEHLFRSEFIPLGRAILGLAESMNNRRLPKRETIEMQIRGVHYLQTGVSSVYGKVPWRIIPAAVQATFLNRCADPALLDLLNQVFDGFPAIGQKLASSQAKRSTSPSQAA
jgi:hypothetical protein